MDCWICGSPADSREHLLKASDLRHFFGDITSNSPVFYHSLHRKNVPIRSAKSNIVKTGKILCRRCNDTRTQPFDIAWEQLLGNLSKNWTVVKESRRYKLQKAFPGSTRAQSVNVHLYFVKLMGCRIVDDRIPIDIEQFVTSMKTQSCHPGVFLTYCFRNIPKGDKHYAGISEVCAKQYNGVAEMATWYYSLGELDIQVTWFKSDPIKNVPYAWHPQRGGKIIKFRQR